jgi:hypothetical protein
MLQIGPKPEVQDNIKLKRVTNIMANAKYILDNRLDKTNERYRA